MAGAAVDVVIAARNESARLGECLAALAAQDYADGPIRVVVVDDGSTDGTAEVGRRAGATVVRAGAGAGAGAGGPAAARNAGLRLADAPFVAFLDAHSIPAPNWVSAMISRFADPQLGGCQPTIENRATDRRVDAYLVASGRYSNAELVETTVWGKRSLYPWLLTGNCMYRRAALEDAGHFDETLAASEDVDLSWRVVLAGWLLGYEPATGIVHHEGKEWSAFLRKGWRYGRGAAQLTAAYAAHGAERRFRPQGLRRPGRAETASNLYYWAGFTFERFGGRRRPSLRPVADVRRFRDPFRWTEATTLRISRRSVYWFRESTAIVVQFDRHERVVLDGVGAFVWRRLARGAPRDAVIAAVVDTYGVSPATAAADLDDLVEELQAIRLLELV